MNKESKEILVKAISDVGFWQWWDQVEGDYMVEFGGVLMYDDMKKGKKARTSVIALGFFDNAFLIFLDNDTVPDWYSMLYEDKIDPFTLDPDNLIFDDAEYASGLLNKFVNRKGPFKNADEARNTIRNAKALLAGTCGDVGFIIGGDTCRVIGSKGDYTDED
ncbi:MAG: hypothetical protein IKR97_01820, partial [Eubacterium sp.]|nr:hypothetical protein [Eubacterium sp.]